jgi:hypothetical protein
MAMAQRGGLMPEEQQEPRPDPDAANEGGEATVSDQDGQQATPEEQAAYEQVVNNATRVIGGENGTEPNKQILEMLGGTDNPVQNLASTAVAVVVSVEVSAQQSGFDIPDDALMAAGEDIVGMLADMAEAAGVHDYAQEEVDGAYYMALDMYREMNPTGRIDPDQLKQEFGTIVEADRAGQLANLIPGIASVLGKGQSEQGQQPPPQAQPAAGATPRGLMGG